MSVKVIVKNSIGENENYTVTNGVKLHKADNSGLQNFYLVTDATAEADDILEGETAYVNTQDGQGGKVTGTIPKKTSTDVTASGKTITVPSGYYASEVSKDVASGSVTIPAVSISVTPTISVDNTGLITATVPSTSGTITSTVSAGYVSSVSDGTVTAYGYNTNQLSTLGAISYDPTSSNQTISSGQYLTGNQTIKGVTYTMTDSGTTSTLDASVIKKDIVINIGTSDDVDSVVSITGQYAGVVPSGKVWISTLMEEDVAGKAFAQISSIEADKITAHNGANIVTGITILGQAGSFSSLSTISQGQSGASSSRILTGYSAFLNGAEVKGSMANNGDVSNTISAKTDSISIPAGYTSGGTIELSTTAKNQLVASKIKAGSTIMGVQGTYSSVPSGYNPITSAQVLQGCVGYVNGSEVYGSMPHRTSNITINSAQGATITSGYYDGTTQALVDSVTLANLTSNNIRENCTILGVVGTMSGQEGVHAVAPSITPLWGDKFFNPSSKSHTYYPSDFGSGDYNYFSSVTVNNISKQFHLTISEQSTIELIIAPDEAISWDLSTAKVNRVALGSTPIDLINLTGDDVEAANVLYNKKFHNNKGVQSTGTMMNRGGTNYTISTTSAVSILQGYYNGNGKISISDAERAKIVNSNIRSGVTILGVSGSSSVVDTALATATSADILLNKTAYVNGTLKTGTIPSLSAAYIMPSSSTQTILSGNYISGTQTIEAVTATKTENSSTSILDASVIKKDVIVKIGCADDDDSVMSITGTYEGNTPSSGTTFTITQNGTYTYEQLSQYETIIVNVSGGSNPPSVSSNVLQFNDNTTSVTGSPLNLNVSASISNKTLQF